MAEGKQSFFGKVFGAIGKATSGIVKGVGKVIAAPFKLAGKAVGGVVKGVSTLIVGKEATDKWTGALSSTVNSLGAKIKAYPYTSKLSEIKNQMIAMLMEFLDKLKGIVNDSNKSVAEAKEKGKDAKTIQNEVAPVLGKNATIDEPAKAAGKETTKSAEKTALKEGKANNIDNVLSSAKPGSSMALAGPLAKDGPLLAPEVGMDLSKT